MKNQQNGPIWTSQRTGIFKNHLDVEQNAAPLSTTFWTQIGEPEMDLEADFNDVAQTLQIQMKELTLAFPRLPKTFKYSISLKELKHFRTLHNSSFWTLPTTSSSAPTLPLKSQPESKSCLADTQMFKKGQ